MTIAEKLRLYLLASYYLVTTLFMALTATLRRWRFSAFMRRVTLRGRGGKGRPS